MLCIIVSFLVIPKLNLGFLPVVLWVRYNPGCLTMAKKGCPDTSVHHCSFLAKNRENCNIISCLMQSRQKLAHLHKTRLPQEPRNFLLRLGQVLILQDIKALPGEKTHEK